MGSWFTDPFVSRGKPGAVNAKTVINYAEKNLQADLSVGQLAEVANLSPRQFSRASKGNCRPPCSADFRSSLTQLW
jgi:AraC-like DNA-binding protein